MGVMFDLIWAKIFLISAIIEARLGCINLASLAFLCLLFSIF